MGCCGKIINGAKGIAKNAAQAVGVPIDQASDEVMLRRREKCRGCIHATRNQKRVHLTTKGLTSLSVCRKCSCNIAMKTRIASEWCPIGEW